MWNELTPMQQAALSPLAQHWPNLNPDQQRNWMAVSRRYPRMSMGERQVLQDRMTEWASLTPGERNQARFNFNSIKSNLSAEQRRAKWDEYRSLPPAERERLARRRHVPRGNAPALGPPQPGRLVQPLPAPAVVVVPPPLSSNESYPYGWQRQGPRVLIPSDRNTLLPRDLPR
jgi:hypothetical protein